MAWLVRVQGLEWSMRRRRSQRTESPLSDETGKKYAGLLIVLYNYVLLKTGSEWDNIDLGKKPISVSYDYYAV